MATTNPNNINNFNETSVAIFPNFVNFNFENCKYINHISGIDLEFSASVFLSPRPESINKEFYNFFLPVGFKDFQTLFVSLEASMVMYNMTQFAWSPTLLKINPEHCVVYWNFAQHKPMLVPVIYMPTSNTLSYNYSRARELSEAEKEIISKENSAWKFTFYLDDIFQMFIFSNLHPDRCCYDSVGIIIKEKDMKGDTDGDTNRSFNLDDFPGFDGPTSLKGFYDLDEKEEY